MERAKLKKAIRHRKEFFEIEDASEYKRVRVRLHAKGVVLRDIVKGSNIRTKKQQACEAGDFIVAEIDAKVGGYGFIPAGLEGAIVSSHYYLFEVDDSVLLPRFLHYCTQTPEFADQLTAQGSTNYAAVRPRDVLDVSIPMPSLERQREIVAWLDSVTDNIKQKRSHLKEAEADLSLLRQRILQDAVQGRVTRRDPDDEPAEVLLQRIKSEKQRLYKAGEIRKPKKLPPVAEDEQPFEVPAGWAWTRLGEMLSESLSNGKSVRDREGGFPVLRLSALQDGRVVTEESKEGAWTREEAEPYIIRRGDFLLARGNGSLSLVGRGALVEDEPEPVAFPDTMIRVRVAEIACSPSFLRHVWNSPLVRAQLEEHARSTSGLHKVNQTHVREAVLPLPPLPEQRRLVERVDRLLALCDRLEATLAAARHDAERLMRAVLEEALAPETMPEAA